MQDFNINEKNVRRWRGQQEMLFSSTAMRMVFTQELWSYAPWKVQYLYVTAYSAVFEDESDREDSDVASSDDDVEWARQVHIQ